MHLIIIFLCRLCYPYRKPEKGINYLVTHQVLEDNPEMVAKFLLTEPGISKQKLGEYLGNLQNEFNMEVLK